MTLEPGPTATQLRARVLADEQARAAAANGAAVPAQPPVTDDGKYLQGPVPTGTPIGICRGKDCAQQVWFGYLRRKDGSMGKSTPVCAGTSGKAPHLVLEDDTEYNGKPVLHAATAEEKAAGAARYTGHFSDCPNAQDYRRR